jgi:SSS family solute:Na+ symporter
VVFLTLAHKTVGKLLPGLPDMVKDFNVGIIALLVNVVALMAVSVVTAGRRVPLAGQTTK